MALSDNLSILHYKSAVRVGITPQIYSPIDMLPLKGSIIKTHTTGQFSMMNREKVDQVFLLPAIHLFTEDIKWIMTIG